MRNSVFAQACTNFLVAIFCLAAATASSAQTLTTLYDFDFNHGRNPSTPLVQGLNGSLYSTTFRGGQNDSGTAYDITLQGSLTDLYSFCLNPISGCSTSYGSNPHNSLILGHDGNFYGITYEGGANSDINLCQFGCGTVFKITASGTVSLIYDFCAQQNCADGADPTGLMQGPDGNFYGTTEIGGANTENCSLVLNLCGTVFKLTPQGVLTTLYSFCSQMEHQYCADGGAPESGVILASNGKFYGTTFTGGPSDAGLIFEITSAGQYSILKNFNYPNAPGFNGLMQASNGILYGLGSYGAHQAGFIFQMSLAGQYSTLYSFCAQTGCPDGNNPVGTLVEGTDGNFYGSTREGGLNSNSNCSTGCGTIFSISPQGKFTNLYNFCSLAACADGFSPNETMIQSTDGKFYGVTSSVEGTIFGFDVGLGPFVTFVHRAGKVGQSGGILGQGFTGTTSVSINGIDADFTVVSDTYMVATVPVGATSGYVNVTTPSGTLTSNVPFLVIP